MSVPTSETYEVSGIISVDDHLVEPPELWTERMPAKFRDAAPRVERVRGAPLRDGYTGGMTREQLDDAVLDVGPGDDARWCDVWNYEGHRSPMFRSIASAGFDPSEVGKTIPILYDEIRPGCFRREDRLADMDHDGIAGSLCFPNDFVRFCGQRFVFGRDRELALACIRAYNDFLVEEWVGPSNGRLHGVSILPLWDAELAACQETGVVVCMHVGSSPSFTTSSDAPSSVPVINFSSSTALSFTDWLLSGTLVRFPDLKLAFAEGQVGWLPYVLDRIDVMWREGMAYNEVAQRLPERPATYLKNMVFCLFDDWVGLSHLDVVGAERVCIETDYPHADGTFPNSRRRIGAIVEDLDEMTRERVVRGNAIDFFGFTV